MKRRYEIAAVNKPDVIRGCSIVAHFFDKDDRALDRCVVPIKLVAPGHVTAVRPAPPVQNVAAAGVAFAGPGGTANHGTTSP